MSYIDKVKVLLNIEDDLQDKMLGLIEEMTTQHFTAYTGDFGVPEKFDYMIIEIMIERFNRIGLEGYSKKTLEGLTLEFNQDDFARFNKILKREYPSILENRGFKML